MSSIALPFSNLSKSETAALGYLSRYPNKQTFSIYSRYINEWFKWCDENGIDPIEATRLHMDLYVRLNIEKGYSPATINAMFCPVKGMYKLAYSDRLIDRDPASVVKLPSVPEPILTPFDRDDMRLFLKTAKSTGSRHFALSMLLGVLGLRVSEACGLDVEQTRNMENGVPILRFNGKGDKPAAIPLPYQVTNAINLVTEGRSSGPLLLTRDGSSRLTRSAARGLLETVSGRTGMDRVVNPHLLRKAAITIVINEAGLEAGQRFARHSDPKTTLRSYFLNKDDAFNHPSHLVAAKLSF